MRIAVVGLGKLGCVLAALYATSGHEVVGVDIDPRNVDLINKGVAPFSEAGLQEAISDAGSRLSATTDLDAAVTGSEATYIIVPTPSEPNGAFTNRFVTDVLQGIGSALRGMSGHHTVVIGSTVMPGSCDGELRQVLEQASGKKVGTDLGLVYSPEFIALGSIVHDMQYPDMVLIGESDRASGDLVERNARAVVRNTPEFRRMNLVNAEITKLAVNTFVTTKISFANMLSEVCQALPGADVDAVTQALGSDQRIGSKYLKGALGYGGPCFPRDNVALSALGTQIGVDMAIAQATDSVNRRQVERMVTTIESVVNPPASVAVLGLAYKPDTPVCDESQGIQIANELASLGYRVLAHDPAAMETAGEALDSEVRRMATAREAIKESHVIVITTPWKEYAEIAQDQLFEKSVIDPWGVLPSGQGIIRPGRNNDYSE